MSIKISPLPNIQCPTFIFIAVKNNPTKSNLEEKVFILVDSSRIQPVTEGKSSQQDLEAAGQITAMVKSKGNGHMLGSQPSFSTLTHSRAPHQAKVLSIFRLGLSTSVKASKVTHR